jgi:hypothetical protein
MNAEGQGSQDRGKDAQITKEERDKLYSDYELVFSLFKTDADIHYRRAQMMLALQTAIFAGFAFKSWGGSLLSMLICIVGGVLSFYWLRYASSQRQFLELRKRMLRDIEARIGDGINVMSVDKEVFFNKKQHVFAATNEVFPDNEGEFALEKIKAGTTRVEEWMSWTFIILWGLLFVGVAISASCPWLVRFFSAICTSAPHSSSAVFE